MPATILRAYLRYLLVQADCHIGSSIKVRLVLDQFQAMTVIFKFVERVRIGGFEWGIPSAKIVFVTFPSNLRRRFDSNSLSTNYRNSTVLGLTSKIFKWKWCLIHIRFYWSISSNNFQCIYTYLLIQNDSQIES